MYLYFPSTLYKICSFFADHNARRVRMSTYRLWYHARISNSQPSHSINLQLTAHHRTHVISWSHLASAHLMVNGNPYALQRALPILITVELVLLASRDRNVVELGSYLLERFGFRHLDYEAKCGHHGVQVISFRICVVASVKFGRIQGVFGT